MGLRQLATLALALVVATSAFAMDPLIDVPVPPSFGFVASQTGPWQSASTWAGGVVPTDGAYVDIPPDIKVTLKGDSKDIEWIQVRGKLALSPNDDSRLYVETIVVQPGGLFQLTGLAATNLAEVVFIRTGVDFENDPKKITRGLIAAGRVDIHGAPKTHVKTVAADVLKDTSTLTLDSAPLDWRAGDELVLAGTVFRRGQPLQDERVTIANINGNVVEVDQDFEYDHLRVTSEGTTPALHVVNLTRNVRFRSESTATTAERGHIMLTHSDSVLENVALIGLGRTDKKIPLDDFEVVEGTGLVSGPANNRRGRYALHVHMTRMNPDSNDATVTVVKGCVVDGAVGWGFANHSSRVDFSDNVAYDFAGAGFVTEAGDELGSFTGNVAMHGTGEPGHYYPGRLNFRNDDRPQAIADVAFSGVGFWFSGPALTVENNVANSCNGDGVVWHTTGTVDPTKVDPDALYGRYTYFPEEWVEGLYGTGLEPRHWKGGSGRVVIADLPILSFHGFDSYANLIGARLRFSNFHSGVWYGEDPFNYKELMSAAAGQADKVTVPTRKVQSIGGLRLWNNEEGFSARYVSHTDVAGVRAINRLDYDTDPLTVPGDDIAEGIESVVEANVMNFTDLLVDGYERALSWTTSVTVPATTYRNFAVDTWFSVHTGDEDGEDDVVGCNPVAQAPSVVASSGGTAAVSWVPPAQVTGSARLRYLLRYKPILAQQWRYKTKAATTDSGTLSGLTAGTTYWVQIVCGCAEGVSNWSPAATFVAQ